MCRLSGSTFCGCGQRDQLIDVFDEQHDDVNKNGDEQIAMDSNSIAANSSAHARTHARTNIEIVLHRTTQMHATKEKNNNTQA